MDTNTTKAAAIAAAAGLLAGLAGGAGAALLLPQAMQPAPAATQIQSATVAAATRTAATAAAATGADIPAIVEAASPGVVSITISKEIPQMRRNALYFDPFSGGFLFPSTDSGAQSTGEARTRQVGGGTGFVFDAEQGLVLTNRHVVSDEDATYAVLLSDGTELAAKVVARDPVEDLAVLRVEKKADTQLTQLPLGDSDSLRVGQGVLAVGYALGQFDNTVTTGVLSAKGRSIVAGDRMGREQEDLRDLLQTDAAINVGNSGGPLIDGNGAVIGVNVAVADGNGIGFAIPINRAKVVMDSVRQYGEIRRPMLGVRYVLLTPAIAKNLRLEEGTQGALIYADPQGTEPAVLPGSAADKAGLRMMDVITAVNGKEVTADRDLATLIDGTPVGGEVALQVRRGSDTLELKATLQETPVNAGNDLPDDDNKREEEPSTPTEQGAGR